MTDRTYFDGLTTARSLAMLLALNVHAMLRTSLSTPEGFPALDMFFRTSTPTFIILFGVMTAVVHEPRAERSSRRELVVNAWSRAVQCYVLFALNVIAVGIADGLSLKYTLLCAAMLGSTPYIAILKYYFVMFLLLPFLLDLLRSVSLYILFFASLTIHLGWQLWRQVPTPPDLDGQPIGERLTDLVFGWGDQVAGPSLLHSFVLYFAGVAFGRWLASRRSGERGSRLVHPALLLGVFAGLGLWALTVPFKLDMSLATLGGMQLRNANHPAYIFVIGGLALAIVIALGTANLRIPQLVSAFGRRGLFAFGFGNLVISVWPEHLTRDWGAAGAWAGLVSVLCVMVVGYDYALRQARREDGKPPAAAWTLIAAASRRCEQASRRFTEALVDRLLGVLHQTGMRRQPLRR